MSAAIPPTSELSPFSKLRLLAGELLSRAGLSARAGITYDGARNLYEAFGYKRELRAEDFYARYKRGGIAARVIEALPKGTWRSGCALVEDEDPTVNTDFEITWNELDERLQIWAAFSRADILAGLGRFAIILIGAPGALEDPLPEHMQPEDILYLSPFSEVDTTIQTWDEDPQSIRFGQPTSYTFRRSRFSTMGANVAKTLDRNVHFSRVLHIADETLDDRVFGNPRMERVWNYLDDLDKVTGAGAEAFWRRAYGGLLFNVDPALPAMTDAEKLAVQQGADELVHGYRRVLAVRGMEPTPLGSDTANFSGPIDGVLTLIAASAGIPKRILMGSERGELASSQDSENWEQRITDRRTAFAEPYIVRPFVHLLIRTGVLPDPLEGYDVRWPEIASLSEKEKADLATAWSGLNAKAGGVVVTVEEIRDRCLNLDPLSPEEIAAATPEPPEEPALPEEDAVPEIPKAASWKNWHRTGGYRLKTLVSRKRVGGIR